MTEPVRRTTPEQQAALDAYWNAGTGNEQRLAYARMMELGLPPAYGEEARSSIRSNPVRKRSPRLTQVEKRALLSAVSQSIKLAFDGQDPFDDQGATLALLKELEPRLFLQWMTREPVH